MTSGTSVLYYAGRVLAPVAILAVGVGGLIVLGQRPDPPSRPEVVNKGVLVETAVAEGFEESFDIEVEGVAVPYRRVTFSAEVPGRITFASPQGRGGKFVEQGTRLYEIDQTDYALAVLRLEAQLTQAAANVAEVDSDISSTQSLIELAREELDLQQRNLKREEAQLARGAGTDARLDDARKLELASRHSLQSLQNQLAALGSQKKSLMAAEQLAAAQLRQAEVDLQRTTVAAPLTGTIIEHLVEEGDYVKAGDPLFRMNDTQRMEVACNLRVDELYWIWLQAGTFSPDRAMTSPGTLEIPPAKATVVFEFDGVEYQWDAVLSRYHGTGVDPATRTVPCRVLVEEPEKVRVGDGYSAGPVAPPTLFSGMYVKIRLPINPPGTLVEVPMRSVRPGGEIWLVRDGCLAIRRCEVARVVGEKALVKPIPGGVEQGDVVVTSPLAQARDGMKVEIISTASVGEVAAPSSSPRDTYPPPAKNAD